MPIHDWTRVSPGTFHNFHQGWMIALRDALNAGRLPDGYFAMVEQRAGGPIPDVLALELPPPPGGSPDGRSGGLAVEVAPPKARFVVRSEAAQYARKADRITLRDDLGKVVTIIELVSPGNKDHRHSISAFVRKVRELLDHGVNLLIVDVFPPTSRDPHGIHPVIWEEVEGDPPFEFSPEQPLTVAAYTADPLAGYVNSAAVGEPLPEAPLFLTGNWYVPCPLEASYEAAWAVMPPPIRRLLEAPAGGT